MSTVKTCGKCKVEKPTSMFTPDKRKAGTFFHYCKECRNATAREVRASHVVPTQSRSRELFDYDDETGLFHTKNGEEVTRPTQDGYKTIWIDSKSYLQHRMAWLYVYGDFPDGIIDHIDGNKSNNKITNLRVGTQALNAQNRKKAQSNNKIGLMGVFKHQDKWRTRIQTRGLMTELGCFDTPEEAHAVYIKAKRELHEFCTI